MSMPMTGGSVATPSIQGQASEGKTRIGVSMSNGDGALLARCVVDVFLKLAERCLSRIVCRMVFHLTISVTFYVRYTLNCLSVVHACTPVCPIATLWSGYLERYLFKSYIFSRIELRVVLQYVRATFQR